jgi:bifunctional enzyme CysN/CysC
MHGAIDPLASPAATPAPRASSLLRFFTCGSVDDGKSTLIGRLLHDTGAIPEDQLATLERDSRKHGTQGDNLDFALLLDGLSAEREQGITIDVAYRYFSTPGRAFIVADTPGHEQYTRNMATGASTANVAIILVDARKGILPQTRRHSYIVSMLGVRDIVLAVNKMDLVDFSRATFERIVADYRAAAGELGFSSIVPIPISARDGDNVTRRSDRASWFDGPTLLDYLETVEPAEADRSTAAFALPVQWVNRPDLDFRGYAGTIASGVARPGDEILVLPGARRSRIARIVTADGERAEAVAGEAITLTLADEIDVSRGDVIVATTHDLRPRHSFAARLLWMTDEPLRVGRDYIVRHATTTANARVAALHHAIDIETFAERPATGLAMNEIGLATIGFDRPLIVSRARGDREFGAFILIDRISNQTVALGVVEDEPATVPAAAPAEESKGILARLRGGIGGKGSVERARFYRDLTLDVALGVGIGAIVAMLSGSVIAGAFVFALELARPFLRALSWRETRSADDINDEGAGI